MEPKNICFNCMREKSGAAGPCPHCGFRNEEYRPEEMQLPPLTSLNGKYVLGRALGAGGFGITYIAFDTHLQIAVAIKELFVKQACQRDRAKTVFVSSRDSGCFEENKKRFLQEARILAMFNRTENEGVVVVRDHFEENGTAYIVMELLDGQTLKQRAGGKRSSFEQIKYLMDPVFRSLIRIHSFGVVHMDVSPDNIMILRDGRAKLLDFGGARFVGMQENTVLTAFKRGYAPPEQYSPDGRVGPWTDVYAAAATVYCCLTAIRPPDAMERLAGAKIRRPSEMGIRMPRKAEEALMKALELQEEDRFQSMEAFRNALFAASGRRKGFLIAAGCLVFAAAVVCTGAVILADRPSPAAASEDAGFSEAAEPAAEEPGNGTKELKWIITFGAYEQDNIEENGQEPLDWIVLEQKEDRLLLLSRYCIDALPYSLEEGETSWELAYIRSWLNQDWLAAAFSEEERNCAEEISLPGTVNSLCGTACGGAVDRLFLLSEEELAEYLPRAADRAAKATPYAAEKGCVTAENGNAFWYLRTPGADSACLEEVGPDGELNLQGNLAVNGQHGIRPAVWIRVPD